MQIKNYILLVIIFLLVSCTEQDTVEVQNNNKAIDYENIDTYASNGIINVVVEIPAGTNHKIEYDYSINIHDARRGG
jgi:inorganic pyrophosphatase